MNDSILSEKEIETLRHIRNSIMHRGKSPSLRELMALLGYSSPRSAFLLINDLIKKGFLRRKPNDNLQIIKNIEDDRMRAQTVDVPLVGHVACGSPMLAVENFETMIPVSVKLARPSFKYFLLKADGDSMNLKGINDGDLVLIRQQQTAENGDSVVALIDDEATIKEFHLTKNAIVLKPKSTKKEHQPIILDRDFQIQGVVIAVIPNL